MSTTDTARHQDEPRPAEGTTPADAIDTHSAKAAGRDVASIGKELYKAFGEEGLTTQAAAVAYNFLFAVAPLLIFFLALGATIGRAINNDTNTTVQNIIGWLTERLPGETAGALEPIITGAVNQAGGGVISIGAVLALFGARGAMGALVNALNVAYHVKETRGFVQRQVLAIGLTFATGLGIILAIALFLVGDTVGDLVAGWVGLSDAWAVGWGIARFPIILAILVLALAALYWKGPNSDIPFRWLSPGAIVAVIGWVIVTLFINVYFRFAGGYASSYGPLGGVLAFVFYLYLMSLVILVGGALNAVLARHAPQAAGAPATGDESGDTTSEATTAVRRAEERFRDAVRDARRQVRERVSNDRLAVAGVVATPPGVASDASLTTTDVAPDDAPRTAPPLPSTAPARGTDSARKGLLAGAGAAAAGLIAILLGRL